MCYNSRVYFQALRRNNKKLAESLVQFTKLPLGELTEQQEVNMGTFRCRVGLGAKE